MSTLDKSTMTAAMSGDVGAQLAVADWYCSQEIPFDNSYEQSYQTAFAEALHWYQLAAEKGDAKAQRKVAEFYFNGTGCQKNNEVAARWFSSAADLGDAEAQFFLGCLYRDGQGVAKDLNRAVEMFRMSSEQGNTSASFWLACAFKEGTDVPLNLSESELLLRKAAEGGHTKAQYELAVMNHYGNFEFPKNFAEALKWYRLAALRGFPDALHGLGQMYEDGLGVNRDMNEAKKYFLRAASMGHGLSQATALIYGWEIPEAPETSIRQRFGYRKY